MWFFIAFRSSSTTPMSAMMLKLSSEMERERERERGREKIKRSFGPKVRERKRYFSYNTISYYSLQHPLAAFGKQINPFDILQHSVQYYVYQPSRTTYNMYRQACKWLCF